MGTYLRSLCEVMTSKLSRWGRSSSLARRGWFTWRASLRHDLGFDFWDHNVEASLCCDVNCENQVRGCKFNGQICTLAYRKRSDLRTAFGYCECCKYEDPQCINLTGNWGHCNKLSRNTFLNLEIIDLLGEKEVSVGVWLHLQLKRTTTELVLRPMLSCCLLFFTGKGSPFSPDLVEIFN